MNDAMIVREAITPELQAYATVLRKLLPNGKNLSDIEALAGAQYARSTGLNPFAGEFFIVPGVGVVPGYRGELQRRQLDTHYRPLTEAEIEWNDVMSGDKAIVCEGIDPAAAAQARAEGRAPQITEGLGIVRKAEQWISYEWRTAASGKRYRAQLPEEQWQLRAQPPIGRSWGWVARNRALKDCLRHAGEEPSEADEILDTARARGIEIDVPEAAKLTAEQAQALVAQSEMLAENARETADMTPDEIIERGQRNIDIMRGPQTEDPLGIDTPPSPDRTAAAAIADAEFAAIPAAPNSIYAIPTSDSAQTNESVPRRKPAAISGGLVGSFTLWAEEFAKTHARWQRDGRPDRMHLLLSIAKLGHPKITPENWEQVQMEMADHAAMPSQPALLNSATHGESS